MGCWVSQLEGFAILLKQQKLALTRHKKLEGQKRPLSLKVSLRQEVSIRADSSVGHVSHLKFPPATKI